MEKAGLNLKEIKVRNLSSILYLLNRDGAISRKDIADRLSLTPAGVTKLCAELLELGRIQESGAVEDTSGAGRRKILLSLNLAAYHALCINAEADRITFSVTQLDGTLLEAAECEPTKDITVITETAAALYDTHRDRNIVCCAVCVMGRVEDNRLGLWDNERLKARLEGVLALPVVMDNNIEAFALAELLYGSKLADRNVLFLKWGPGIASAAANHGEVLSGANYDVTEIGHYIIRKNGKKCRCGRYGCLETEVSTLAMESERGGTKSIDEIIQSTDADTVNYLDEKLDLVAIALTNTATILNSGKIILFGSMFHSPGITDKMIRQCSRYNGNFEKNTIALSQLNGKISYIGAAAVAAKSFFFEGFAADEK